MYIGSKNQIFILNRNVCFLNLKFYIWNDYDEKDNLNSFVFYFYFRYSWYLLNEFLNSIQFENKSIGSKYFLFNCKLHLKEI